MANSTPITIKKYANRRLYNTASSAYVTLADLAKMVKAGEDFIVYDAKTNEDITRSVLTQIIFEQEGIEGQSLLPTTFLRQLIRFYGDSMQAILPSYLEFSIDRFSGEQTGDARSRKPHVWPGGVLRRLVRRHAGIDEKEFRGVQSSFGDVLALRQRGADGGRAPKKANSEGDIDDLRSQLSDMQKRLEIFGQEDRDALKAVLARAELREHRRRLRPLHARPRPESPAPPPAETDWRQARLR